MIKIKIFCLYFFLLLLNFFFLFFTPFFWSGTGTEVFSQSSSLFEHLSVNNGLPSHKVFDACMSNDGNIWFATSKGVCRFDGIAFHCFFEKDGLTNTDITGLFTDQNGRLWCWSSAGEIFFFENNKFSPLIANEELISRINNRIINSVCLDSAGNLLVSSVIPGELFKILSGSRIEEITLSGKNDFSFFILQASNKNFVFGSLKTKMENNLLSVFLSGKRFSISLSEKGNFSKISFFPLKNGEFLFSKGQEIIHVRNGTILKRSFTEKNVEDIVQDSDGKIWVGLYQGGVICYPEGSLSSAGMINYLGDKSVSSILEDNSGNIWFTTMEDGIYNLPVRSGLIYSSPKIYSEKNGSKNSEKPKAVIFSGTSVEEVALQPGFRIISTDTSGLDTIPPAIFISGVKILEKDTLILNHYDLRYDKNFLKINFVGFSFSNPEALKYKYKMEGIDKSWIYTDNTFAQYTTLPAGNFLFTVSAMNKNGIWSDSPASISFIIYPPFWRTWWFILILLFFTATIVVTLFSLRIAQIKKREKEKAEMNRQMANAELLALRAQMNPHFIFNTLSSVQHFITTNETEAALKYLSKFAKLMRKILDNSKKSAIPVKDELEALGLYLELESLRFKNKFSFSVIVSNEIDQNDDEIPPMLIQPYVENAIFHGLMYLEKEKGKLLLELKKSNGMIVCSIEDNGIGREKSREIRLAKGNSHSSSGMSITKNRLEILNAMHGSNLSVNIADLKKGKNEAAGTRVEIFIPI